MKRTKQEYLSEYQNWLSRDLDDPDLRPELESMDDAAIEDAFFQDLSFGTGGLRGTIGAGTNRMNIYTVQKASQGVADYINAHYPDNPSIVIARDSRIKSREFSDAAIGVFATNGIQVYAYDRIMPTPVLSFTVRELSASAGIMITASHNPKEYNGYKVYGADGCQITTEAAKEIQEYIKSVDTFEGIHSMSWSSALIRGKMQAVEKMDQPVPVYERYIDAVLKQSVLYGDDIKKDISIVYTPLNGTGLHPVTNVLNRAGYTNITVVESQSAPDGTFPTCPKPNPEVPSAMEEGLSVCRDKGADLLIATDPDADRCGIAIKTADDDYRLLTADETGLLLLDYICSQRVSHNCMPTHPVFMKTIVTNDLAEKIAANYGVDTINVLTGFKFIGEKICELEKQSKADDFIFAFEESYGYLTGTYARDKDGVLAAFLIAEMFCFYRTKGISLEKKLEDIYASYGYCLNTQKSYQFEGSVGMARMKEIMTDLRSNPLSVLGTQDIIKAEDYSHGLYELPQSDVLKYYTDDYSLVVRPSGTEPKLKIYFSITADDRASAEQLTTALCTSLETRLQLP